MIQKRIRTNKNHEPFFFFILFVFWARLGVSFVLFHFMLKQMFSLGDSSVLQVDEFSIWPPRSVSPPHATRWIYNLTDMLCVFSYKGEGIVNGSPEKVWECLKPIPNGLRVSWDNNVRKFELLEQITEVWHYFFMLQVTHLYLSVCFTNPAAPYHTRFCHVFKASLFKVFECGTAPNNTTIF